MSKLNRLSKRGSRLLSQARTYQQWLDVVLNDKFRNIDHSTQLRVVQVQHKIAVLHKTANELREAGNEIVKYKYH